VKNTTSARNLRTGESIPVEILDEPPRGNDMADGPKPKNRPDRNGRGGNRSIALRPRLVRRRLGSAPGVARVDTDPASSSHRVARVVRRALRSRGNFWENFVKGIGREMLG